MKNVLKVILYVIGFPALVALVAYNSLVIYESGDTYGFWPYVGLILAGVLAIVYTIIFIVTGKNSKKHQGNYNRVRKSVATLVVMSFVLTAGIWLVVDIPKILPGILNTATQGTRLFHQLHEDYNAQAVIHGNLLDDYIKMNVANGNLSTDEHSEEEWLELGFQSEEVKALMKQNFVAMDKNGYKTFTSNGPWLNLANDNRQTIPVLVHLLLNEREVDQEVKYYLQADITPKEFITDKDGDEVNKKPVQNEEVETVITWSILDMQGTPITIDLGGALGGALSGMGMTMDDVAAMIASLTLDKTISGILGDVNGALADPALANAELYVGVDMRDGGMQIVLTPAAPGRGMHGYQNSAWLDSNNLLFALISVFPARQWLYIWGAIIIFASVAVGALRLKQFGGKKEETTSANDYDDDEEDVNVQGLNKYERTVISAIHARNKMK